MREPAGLRWDLLQEGETRVEATLTARRKELEALAQMLLHDETVERDALLRILAEQLSAEVPERRERPVEVHSAA